MHDAKVVEDGDFREDGVAFTSAPILLEFIDPADEGGVLPTGHAIDRLSLPDGSAIDATLVSAGNPTVFVRARDVGLDGGELPAQVNANAPLLARLEAIRAAGAVAMGLAVDAGHATRERPATPKVAFVAPPAPYRSTDGATIALADHDLRARIVSMGRLHHAFTGTGSIALAVAAALPGTIVAQCVRRDSTGLVRIGHAAGVLAAAAELGADRQVRKVVVTRGARVLMSGQVHIPSHTLAG